MLPPVPKLDDASAAPDIEAGGGGGVRRKRKLSIYSNMFIDGGEARAGFGSKPRREHCYRLVV